MDSRYGIPAGSADVAPALTLLPLPGRSGLRAMGEISLGTRGEWERALEGVLCEDEDEYYLELSAVTFVDVAGVGALAAAAQRLPDGRRIVLHRPPAVVRRVLDMLWPGIAAIEVSMS
ncbi:STAS domain-containing protein [Streptomyces sp. Ru71]|uniref:STAS domain-containing protein n=1 Tax=Streptomyces sp. Ru71 TaxID=2080746 RepID=UPI0021560965|nr:STAS domain-containing protein [Streptomyces sp. Ru71]